MRARRAPREDGMQALSHDAEPVLAPGDHVFVHDSQRQHLVWAVTRTGNPIVLIDGRFRALCRDAYLPLAGSGG